MIYAIGDIHGRPDIVDAIRMTIALDSAQQGDDNPLVIWLGDYIDRGYDSKGVIDRLMNPRFSEICLKGNHEEMMYKAIDHSTRSTSGKSGIPNWRDMWLTNGGIPTLLSYGVLPKDESLITRHPHLLMDPDEWDWKEIQEIVPRSHIEWMKQLQICHAQDGYFFVHAGVDPRRDVFDQIPGAMLWIRDLFLDHNKPFVDSVNKEWHIVHGHTPVKKEVFHNSIRTNLDVGAVWFGKAAIMAIDPNSSPRFIYTPYCKAQQIAIGNR